MQGILHVRITADGQRSQQNGHLEKEKGEEADGPKRRWRDDMDEKAEETWTHTASDRMKWKGLWKPSASSGMNG